MKEERLAAQVIEYLTANHWDIYQEVQLHEFGPVADIVAIQSGRLWVVECKDSLGLSVLAQAYRWIPYAHFVSVAVSEKRHREREFISRILNSFGIGWLSVCYGTKEIVTAKLHRTVRPDLKEALKPQQKTFAPAGNSYGKKFTRFQETAFNIRRAVSENPGISLNVLIGQIKTHYASTQSARSNIRKWIEFGVIEGVKLHRQGKYLLVYPTDYQLPEKEDSTPEPLRLPL